MAIDWTALAVFIALFALITWIGFLAARWRRGDLGLLHEWGLGGRRFGTVVTWFLLGGDIYTAYTFIAVPAVAFGAGALAFFVMPYCILMYLIVFVVYSRLWHVAHKHGYLTTADFVRGRYDNRWLSLAVAFTGIMATLPYIALQLVGLQVVIAGLGLGGQGWLGEIPLIVAFVILSAFTYTSGLRAPAAISIVKDVLMYVVVIAAVIVIPIALGGYGKIFAAVPAQKLLLAIPSGNSTGSYGAYITLALGSAMAFFLYPHTVTGLLSASSAKVVRRNAALLPAYTVIFGLLVLLGFMALAAGVDKLPEFAEGFGQYKANFAVPALFLHSFPSWFTGVAFATIGIGALVPAAIMSIAAANLFTRNVYKEFINARCTDAEESRMAKLASLIVKFGALLFILFIPTQYALYLQLLGGIWIIQTFPSVILGLYTRWFNHWALLLGWAVGIVLGTSMAWQMNFVPTYPLAFAGWAFPGYTALYTVIMNFAVAIVLTPVFNAMGSKGRDRTAAADYVGTN